MPFLEARYLMLKDIMNGEVATSMMTVVYSCSNVIQNGKE